MNENNNLRHRRRRNERNVTNRNSLLNSSMKRASKEDGKDDSEAVTSSLQRTKQMMHSELERVSLVSDAIDNNGKTIFKTKEKHLEMVGSVKGAKGSLGWLKVKEKEESIVFWSAVVFFYVVVFYVMWTRMRIPFILW